MCGTSITKHRILKVALACLRQHGSLGINCWIPIWVVEGPSQPLNGPLVAKFRRPGWWQGRQNGALGSSRGALEGPLGQLGAAMGANVLQRGSFRPSGGSLGDHDGTWGGPQGAKGASLCGQGTPKGSQVLPKEDQDGPRDAKMAAQWRPGGAKKDSKWTWPWLKYNF